MPFPELDPRKTYVACLSCVQADRALRKHLWSMLPDIASSLSYYLAGVNTDGKPIGELSNATLEAAQELLRQWPADRFVLSQWCMLASEMVAAVDLSSFARERCETLVGLAVGAANAARTVVHYRPLVLSEALRHLGGDLGALAAALGCRVTDLPFSSEPCAPDYYSTLFAVATAIAGF